VNYFWGVHLKNDPDQMKEFQAYVKNSKPVLDRAIDYLNYKASGVYPTTVDYSSPNWDYLQADRNGYLRALSEFEAFLDVTNSKTGIKETWLTKTKQTHPTTPKQTFFNRLTNPLRKLKQRIW